MADSGLEEVLKSSFGSVANMLAGKRFPQNVRALRLVVEELLREFLVKTDCYSDLMEALGDAATQSKTTDMWVENLVKLVFIMMLFVRAEREGDWPLHLWAVKEMLPYFFAASHINYARYGLYYLRSMEKLPKEILTHFLKGEHVTRHKPGIWNAIWSVSQHSCVMVMGQMALLVSLCSHQHSNDGPSACTHVVSLCMI